VKLKTESLNLNFLQEQCAELEKEKKILNIEIDALQKELTSRLSLLDSKLIQFVLVFFSFSDLFFCFSLANRSI